MCIRDRVSTKLDLLSNLIEKVDHLVIGGGMANTFMVAKGCLLYTSDAADERSSVDLGGRRIIKKKKQRQTIWRAY